MFRLVKAVPPAAADMITHLETGRLPRADACLRCGLSVFRDLRDAAHQRRLLPKLGRHIARGMLLPEHGKAKLTTGQQPTHTMWWAFEDVDRAGLFTVVPTEA